MPTRRCSGRALFLISSTSKQAIPVFSFVSCYDFAFYDLSVSLMASRGCWSRGSFIIVAYIGTQDETELSFRLGICRFYNFLRLCTHSQCSFGMNIYLNNDTFHKHPMSISSPILHHFIRAPPPPPQIKNPLPPPPHHPQSPYSATTQTHRSHPIISRLLSPSAGIFSRFRVNMVVLRIDAGCYENRD